MRRQTNIPARVYNYLYPNPTPQDPQDFSQHLIRNLITEVRIETQRFYGGLELIEAKYPGLNYSHPPHRKRLSYFPHHRRLFQAFDDLGLTVHEIAELCKWEGTLWARQRYERDEKIKVRDTTGEEIKPWTPMRRPASRTYGRRSNSSIPSSITVETQTRWSVEFVHPQRAQPLHLSRPAQVPVPMQYRETRPLQQLQQLQQQQQHSQLSSATSSDDEIMEMEHDMSDSTSSSEISSHTSNDALDLRDRLIASAREQAAAGMAVDPAYEAYLKEAAESSVQLRRPSGTIVTSMPTSRA